jgi:hypothetical protein
LFRLSYQDPIMGFAPDQLRDTAFAAVAAAAEAAGAGPLRRTKALGFALAYLWAYAGGDRAPYTRLWRSLAIDNDIARNQNINAALNAIRRALGS